MQSKLNITPNYILLLCIMPLEANDEEIESLDSSGAMSKAPSLANKNGKLQ